MPKASPTQRTKSILTKRGVTHQVVERWQATPYSKLSGRRIDLFGIIDLVALEGFIVGIQATTRANIRKRIDKSLAEPRLREWLKCGGRFEVWGWDRRNVKTKNGKTVTRWRVKVIDLSERDGTIHENELTED